MEREKASASLYGIQSLQGQIEDLREEHRLRFAHDDLELHRMRVLRIREKLQAPDYQIDQEISTEDRNGHLSGAWIFKEPRYEKWSNRSTSGHEILYVNGKPGSGERFSVRGILLY